MFRLIVVHYRRKKALKCERLVEHGFRKCSWWFWAALMDERDAYLGRKRYERSGDATRCGDVGDG